MTLSNATVDFNSIKSIQRENQSMILRHCASVWGGRNTTSTSTLFLTSYWMFNKIYKHQHIDLFIVFLAKDHKGIFSFTLIFLKHIAKYFLRCFSDSHGFLYLVMFDFVWVWVTEPTHTYKSKIKADKMF